MFVGGDVGQGDGGVGDPGRFKGGGGAGFGGELGAGRFGIGGFDHLGEAAPGLATGTASQIFDEALAAVVTDPFCFGLGHC